MKLFLITFNKYSYDEHDAFVIAAATGKEAIGILKKRYPDEEYWAINWKAGYTIKKIGNAITDKPEIILGSYNAGYHRAEQERSKEIRIGRAIMDVLYETFELKKEDY